MSAFWTGVLAGYGIAIPVGAIAILILETGLREGFARSFVAGAGAASADFLYAAVAAAAGSAAALTIAQLALPLKITSWLGNYNPGLRDTIIVTSEQRSGSTSHFFLSGTQ